MNERPSEDRGESLPGESGIAEPAAPDTGLPIAEPFPPDVEPEGGPIGPEDDLAPNPAEAAAGVGPEAVVVGQTDPSTPLAGAGVSSGNRPQVVRGADLADGAAARRADRVGSATGQGAEATAPSAVVRGDGDAVVLRRGEPAASVTAAPQETARGDGPRAAAAADDDASLGAAQPVGLDDGMEAPQAGAAAATNGSPTAGAAIGAETSAAPGGAAPGTGSTFCPPGYPVKADAATRRYRLPDAPGYRDLAPDFCFKTAEAAAGAGFAKNPSAET